MSLEQITAVVENFISDTRNDLLVIRGKWGAGKTYFWQKTVEDSKRKKCIGRTYYSYVSLFGVNSLEELKNTVLVSRVESSASEAGEKLDSFAASLKQITRGWDKIPKLREYTGELISNLLYHSIDNTLVCFDDIERKGNGLDLKDIFGLAAVLKEQRGCKVALIMNDEGLQGNASEQFRLHGEKIIDREVLFSITAEEAFGYVFEPSFNNRDLLKASCLNLHIKNVRTLQRIRRFVEDVTPPLRGSEEQTVESVLRSLVLFVWSRFDTENHPPPPDYILNYSSVRRYIDKKYKNRESSPEEERWDALLSSYDRWYRPDEVDKCLAQLVQTGYIDRRSFAEELEKKDKQYRVWKGDESYRQVWDLYLNSFANNEAEFVGRLVDSFRLNMDILSLSNLQAAASVLREFERDDLANTLIDEYFSRRSSEQDVESLRKIERTIYARDLMDEYLLERLRGIWSSSKTDTRSLAEVLKAVESNEYQSLKDLGRLNSFSADDYYQFFKTEQSDSLSLYVNKLLSFDELEDKQGAHKSVAGKTKEALLRLAAESKINRLRVSNIYKIAAPEPAQPES